MPDVYAKSNTSISNQHGVVYRLVAGEAWDADDLLVRAHPEAFADSPPRRRTSNGWVEKASAAPGEKRKSGR